ncbi:hypothetical protein [Streptomyces sp. NPDC050564]|uniref:hypothetical protein n=1 Tax=Streptomyces sp. NPDC050564 TaxID=3365631 RepID=UPI0037B09A44
MTASLESAPPAMRQIIEQIAAAVHEGDDAALPYLLECFAEIADLQALFALRQRLRQDLHRQPGPAGDSPETEPLPLASN